MRISTSLLLFFFLFLVVTSVVYAANDDDENKKEKKVKVDSDSSSEEGKSSESSEENEKEISKTKKKDKEDAEIEKSIRKRSLLKHFDESREINRKIMRHNSRRIEKILEQIDDFLYQSDLSSHEIRRKCLELIENEEEFVKKAVIREHPFLFRNTILRRVSRNIGHGAQPRGHNGPQSNIGHGAEPGNHHGGHQHRGHQHGENHKNYDPYGNRRSHHERQYRI